LLQGRQGERRVEAARIGRQVQPTAAHFGKLARQVQVIGFVFQWRSRARGVLRTTDGDQHVPPLGIDLHFHRAAGRAGNGHAEQMDEDLAESYGRQSDARQALGLIHVEGHLMAVGELAGERQDGRQRFGQIGAFAAVGLF